MPYIVGNAFTPTERYMFTAALPSMDPAFVPDILEGEKKRQNKKDFVRALCLGIVSVIAESLPAAS
jgi:hypothetical protein